MRSVVVDELLARTPLPPALTRRLLHPFRPNAGEGGADAAHEQLRVAPAALAAGASAPLLLLVFCWLFGGGGAGRRRRGATIPTGQEEEGVASPSAPGDGAEEMVPRRESSSSRLAVATMATWSLAVQAGTASALQQWARASRPPPSAWARRSREASRLCRWRAGAGGAAAAGAAAGAGAEAAASRWTAARCATRTSTCPRCA